MKSILILTDFSEAAFRAAEYACELVSSLQIQRLVLYHAYQTHIAGSDLPIINVQGGQNLYFEGMESLALLQDRLKPMVAYDIHFDLLAEDVALADLASRLRHLCVQKEISLIVMGVSGRSTYEKLLLGSTTSEVFKMSALPLLIVPQHTKLGIGVQRIVFATDLKGVSSIPVQILYDYLDALPAKLLVVNVHTEGEESYSTEMHQSIAGLHELLDRYDAAFHYINGADVVETIHDFCEEQHASLVIAVHQKHGFWFNLFNRSIAKKLAYKSSIPMLSLPPNASA